jgi:oligopeptide transport system permease protein
MSVAQPTKPSAVPSVQLRTKKQGESLWADSFRRLRRNRMAMLGLVIIIIFIFMSIFADQLAPMSYRQQTLAMNNAAPQWVIDMFPVMTSKDDGGYVTVSDTYMLGADGLGRDMWSRIIYGSRVSLAVAFVGPLVAISVGLTLGVIAGYVGGRVDNIIMRLVDIVYAFPTLLLIILIMAFFRGGGFSTAEAQGTLGAALYNLDVATGGVLFIFIGVGLTSWVGLARLARGQVLSVREREYVVAADSIGANGRWIMIRHVLPNILGPVIVAETLAIPTYIRYEAFLSFIGLGVNPPTPSWGAMISEGSRTIATYPNQTLFPALALFLLMFAFNFLGDGLRDALDPRMRGVD